MTDHGWSAEFRIPLRVLRFPALPVQSWDFQASRYISGKQENDDWAYFPRSVAGEVSHYGRLDGLEGLEEKTPMEFRPFLVGRVRRRDPAVGQLASGWDTLVSGGLDLKWHPTPGLTLDATFNPDFAQVEADQVVLNLSTVETYYPEKRPFFLEGIRRVPDSLSASLHAAHRARAAHPRAPDRPRQQGAPGRRPRAFGDLRRDEAHRHARQGVVRRNDSGGDCREYRAGAGGLRLTGATPRQRDASRRPDVVVRGRAAQTRPRRRREHRVHGDGGDARRADRDVPAPSAERIRAPQDDRAVSEPRGAHAARPDDVEPRAERALLQRRVRRRGRLALAVAGGRLRDGRSGRGVRARERTGSSRGRRDDDPQRRHRRGDAGVHQQGGGEALDRRDKHRRRVARVRDQRPRVQLARESDLGGRQRAAPRAGSVRSVPGDARVPLLRHDVRLGRAPGGPGALSRRLRALQEFLVLQHRRPLPRNEVRRPRSGRRYGPAARRAVRDRGSRSTRTRASASSSASTRSATRSTTVSI